MPATDVEQQLREAIVAILGASSTIATLCGGTARIVDRETPGPASTLPCLAYDLIYDDITGRAELLLTGIADEGDALGKARELVKAAVGALTQPAFAAQASALQVAPSAAVGQNVAEVGEVAVAGTPNLRQADRSLTLVVCE